MFDGFYHTLVETINSARADFAKSTPRPRSNEQWVLRTRCYFKLAFTDSDKNRTLLNKTLVALANTFVTGRIRPLIESETKIPIRGFGLQPWDRPAEAIARPLGNTRATLTLWPMTTRGIQPVVGKQANSIRMGGGVSFSTVLRVGKDFVDAEPPMPLPAVEESHSDEQPQSRLRLPSVVDVTNLRKFLEPLPVASVGRNSRMESLETTEKDGLRHGRLSFSALRAARWWPLLPKMLMGVVPFQARLTCSSERGQLAITDFAFTHRSSSLLVDLQGDQSNQLICAAIEDAVPALSDAMFRRADVAARASVNQLLHNAIGHRARSVAEFSADLARVAADVSGIEFKPIDAMLMHGHLIVNRQADVNISIRVEEPWSGLAALPREDD